MIQTIKEGVSGGQTVIETVIRAVAQERQSETSEKNKNYFLWNYNDIRINWRSTRLTAYRSKLN
jgi:hypothetical protein